MRVIQVQCVPQSEAHKPAGERSGHQTERLVLSDIIGSAPKGEAGDVVCLSLRTGRTLHVDLSACDALPVIAV